MSEDDGKHELKHEAVPGYGRALAVVLAIAAVYLLVIFLLGGSGAPAH